MILKYPYESKWEETIESQLSQVSTDFIGRRFPDELRDQRAAGTLCGKSVRSREVPVQQRKCDTLLVARNPGARRPPRTDRLPRDHRTERLMG